MYDTERRQRVISSTPHLSPEEIANRSFDTKMRGFSEPEVRGFLKRVSEELTGAYGRVTELEAAVDALEEQLRTPRPLSEQELLDALGEETARLLRSAREASDEIRKKAEERASRLVEEARDASDRTRAEADEVLAHRTQVAEAKVAVMLGEAEARAGELQQQTASEVDGIVEAARVQGKDMLDEAKAARERVLADLIRRRALLNAQIEELRGGRDRLLEAYRTVKRTFLEATEALGQVEVRAAAERSTTAEPIDLAAEIAAEIEAIEGGDNTADAAESGAETQAVAVVDVATGDDARAIDLAEDETKLADVDSLFARLRAGQPEDTLGAETDATPAEAEGAVAVAVEPQAAPDQPEPAAETAAEPTADAADAVPRLDPTQWKAKRAEAVDPLSSSLFKRAKRMAQDDQNALLDAVRRHKGRPHADQVLPELAAALDSWSIVMRDAINAAYSAGRVAAGASAEPATDALAHEGAQAVVQPLRERITVAIDSGDAGDTGGLVERIGARYREWKNQSLERTLGEVLAFSWARGVYDAVPDGETLRWVPFEEGRCADCDDNALEPTVKGAHFPTGQPFPPAHVGCKCLVAPASILR